MKKLAFAILIFASVPCFAQYQNFLGKCINPSGAVINMASSAAMSTSALQSYVVFGAASGGGYAALQCDANGNLLSSASAFTTLVDSATVTWAIGGSANANTSLTFTVHSGSRTLNITNPANGGNYVIKIVQDGTGGEGLTLGTGCTWKVSNGGGGAITPSTGANAIDILAFTYDGTNCYANFQKNFS